MYVVLAFFLKTLMFSLKMIYYTKDKLHHQQKLKKKDNLKN